jgi:hypothetical protein
MRKTAGDSFESSAACHNGYRKVEQAFCSAVTRLVLSLFTVCDCSAFSHLGFHRLHVEAGPFLQRRELDQGCGGLCDLLLNKDKTPKGGVLPLTRLEGYSF